LIPASSLIILIWPLTSGTNPGEIAGNGVDDDHNGFIDDVHGWDFVNNTNDPQPKFQDGFNEAGIMHGTIVAGIIAAAGNNAKGFPASLGMPK